MASLRNCKVRIDSIAEINPARLDKSFRHLNIKYVDIGNVDRGCIKGFEELRLEDSPSRAQRLARDNDFIISTVRPGNRSYAYIKTPDENMVFSTGFAVIRAIKCDPRYLYYVLTSDLTINYLASIADSKSAYPSINPSDIGEIEISLPPLETQREIAHILGTLDDKIELNRKMSKTLEEMAQTLYKHWFIDFEFPNEEGKPYKSSGGEMIDSELGPIPKGWKVGTIGSVCTFEYGKSLKSDVRKFGKYPVMGSNGQIGWHNECLVHGPGVVVGRKGNPGAVTFVIENFFPIDTTFYVKSISTEIPMMFLYAVLSQSNLGRLSADSAVPGLNRDSALSKLIILPRTDILHSYEWVTKSLFTMKKVATEQTSSLDSMLTRLMTSNISTDKE